MVSNVIDLRMEQRCSGIFRGQGREFRLADLVLVFSVPGEQQNSLRRFNPNCYRVIVGVVAPTRAGQQQYLRRAVAFDKREYVSGLVDAIVTDCHVVNVVRFREGASLLHGSDAAA